jgi:hypothetical protein
VKVFKFTLADRGCVRRTIRLGEQPIQLALYAYYSGIRPTAGQDTWQLQAKLTFIISETQPHTVLKKEP